MSFKDKVVYQIYPKSFCDSNQDGFGDLKGILSKLDYLKELGVDYIWITPFFPSPQADNGYDVADYCDVDPSYGTMEDLEELIAEAKKRGIYLMFDMVFNHTSTEHKWFQEALKGNKKYKNYYFFKKGKDGREPTNWCSKFGGSAWKYVEELDEYYLHLYDEMQADVDWTNPEVREEFIKVLNFWIQKGVRGFRFDVVNNIDKQKFEDCPEGIGKQFYCDQPRVHTYLHEMNTNAFGEIEDCITVGEMSSTSVENCIGYTNPENKELDMVFNFHHLKVDYVNKEKWTSMPFDFKELKSLFNTWQIDMQEGNGWNALFWNCHDQPRSLSRFGDDKNYPFESAAMLATTLHMMRGTPYIYQGEEIGMTNHYFDTIDQYRDIESINAYHILKEEGKDDAYIRKVLQEKSRDNARTPMQWDDSSYAGFSSHEPWIPVIDNYKDINVKKALENKDSIFYYYQKLIQLRKEYTVIQEGDYVSMLEDHDSIFAYKRVLGKEEVLVFNNFYGQDSMFEIEEDLSEYSILLGNYKNSNMQKTYTLKPYETIVLYKG